ncbi:MAG: ATP-binding protein [Acidimicrobiia bacterium]
MTLPMAHPQEFGLGALFDAVPDAVIVAEARSGEVVLWNRGATELFGYAASEAIGMPLLRIVPPEMRERHEHGIRRFVETGSAVLVESGLALEVPALHQDGSRFWLELRLSPLPGAGLPGVFVMAIMRDVSQRRRAYAELEMAHSALREFLSMASHDLRNPLTAISAAAEMLTEDRGNRPDREELVSIINRQTQWLSTLVADFEVVAQVEVGAVQARPENVVVAELIRDAVSTDIEITASAGLVANVDPLHLRRIVTNLVQNAQKYGAPPVAITVSRAASGIVVAVSDSGPGIPVEHRARIFEKFWRGPGRRESGTGLGLAIVRGLTEANGGRVWFDQTPLPTFAVWLRAATG